MRKLLDFLFCRCISVLDGILLGLTVYLSTIDAPAWYYGALALSAVVFAALESITKRKV